MIVAIVILSVIVHIVLGSLAVLWVDKYWGNTFKELYGSQKYDMWVVGWAVLFWPLIIFAFTLERVFLFIARVFLFIANMKNK